MGGWRNEVNRGGAWVFFKVQAEGSTEWQPVRLVADRVVNPTGYSQGEGGPLQFVVPDGDDGFTGMFLLPAKGSTEAGGAGNITALWDFTANKGITKDVKVRVRVFASAMAYVAEGPFYLGSGGTEWNRFYKYTDGSQHTEPYRVMGSGAIPSGRQDGRLWARKGAQPDDGGEIPAAFPNGYAGFYCMMFQVTYAQYVGFLNTLPAEVADKYHVPGIKPYYVWYNHAGTQPMRIIRTNDASKDPFTVELHTQGRWNPANGWDRELHGMSWADGAAYAAWAGMRPMSELEFEKICRGPRDPVPHETGPSHWNISSFPGGNDFGAQWPAHRRHTDRAVTVANPEGRGFKGTHGNGTWILPADWPKDDAVGAGFRGGGMSMPGSRLSDRLHAAYVDLRRRPYCSFRCVRTAPNEDEQDAALNKTPAVGDGSVLKMDPLPDLRDSDIGIFYLAGSFQSAGDKPLNVELTSTLPEACFPKGAASLALAAKPKEATPFRITTTLTLKNARTARYGQSVPFRVKTTGGDVLAEQSVRLPLSGTTPFVVGSLDGGTVTLRITNATDRPQPLVIALQPPPRITLPEAEQRVELAAGTQARVSFPVPRQVFRENGVCPIPYRVTVADGAPQSGEIVTDLRLQSRWWVSRRVALGPKVGAGVDSENDGLGDLGEAFGTDEIVNDDGSVFKAATRPAGWSLAVYGAGIPFGGGGALPSRGSVALAATLVVSRIAGEAVLDARHDIPWSRAVLPSGKKVDFPVRVWLNGAIAYDSRADAKERSKPVRMRKGGNTMLVECRSENDGSATPGDVFVTFQGAADGKALDDLVLDMDSR